MKPPRRGVSLTEMLVVMTACTVAFSLSGQLLTRVMRVYGQAQNHADVERTALRLSTQFRQDVHQAVDATASSSKGGNNEFLELQLPDGSRLEYASVANSVVRQRRRDGEVAARETYSFPEAIKIVVRRQDGPARIGLSVKTERPELYSGEDGPLGRATRGPVDLHVTAVLGRDQPTAVAANGVEVLE